MLTALPYPILRMASLARHLAGDMAALAGRSLVPVSGLAILLWPGAIVPALPPAVLALAATVFLTAVVCPNPTRLLRLPVWLTAITLLRLLADTVATVTLLHNRADSDLFGELSWLIWIPIAGVVLLQSRMVMLGARQSSVLEHTHARFTLDALPGKMMAIDADAHSGLITVEEARLARIEVEKLQDFFDFLRRSALFARLDVWISGFLLLATGWEAWLVFAYGSQSALDKILIHNLLSSVACLWLHEAVATVREKAVGVANLGSESFGPPKGRRLWSVWLLVAALLLWQGLLWLLLVVALNLLLPERLFREAEEPCVGSSRSGTDPASEPLVVEVGANLIPLLDPRAGAPLLVKAGEIRQHLFAELGFLCPGVRFRANLQLRANQYLIVVHGCVVSAGDVLREHRLALGPRAALDSLEGVRVNEPAYGMPAIWLKEDQCARAAGLGCLLFSRVEVVASDLSHRVRVLAGQLLTLEQVRELAAPFANLSLAESEALRVVLSELLDDGVPLDWNTMSRVDLRPYLRPLTG